MQAVEVRIESITIGDRFRRDLGAIDALAESIDLLGVLQPIVLDDNLRLIAGYRRVAACGQLGMTLIPAVIVDRLDDALLAVTAERDENTCRKDFVPSELAAIGRAIEAIERPKAEERMKAGVAQPCGPGTTGSKTRDVVAAALGTSPRTYARIRKVVDAASDPELPENVRSIAAEQVAAIDAGGSIHAAEEAVATAKRFARGGPVPEPGRHEMLRKTRRINPNRIVNETVVSLEGLQLGLALVEVDQLDTARVDEWATSLRNSIRSLNRFLKEMTRDRS